MYIIQEAYVDEDYPCMRILAVAAFSILSNTISLKLYSPGQFIFSHYLILPIRINVDW